MQIRNLFMSHMRSQGPEHNTSTAPEPLKGDFCIHFHSPHPPSSLVAAAAPVPHPHLNKHLICCTYAHASFSIHSVPSDPHALMLFLCMVQMETEKKSREHLKSSWVSPSCKTCIIRMLLPFFYFSRGEKQRQVVCNW